MKRILSVVVMLLLLTSCIGSNESTKGISNKELEKYGIYIKDYERVDIDGLFEVYKLKEVDEGVTFKFNTEIEEGVVYGKFGFYLESLDKTTDIRVVDYTYGNEEYSKQNKGLIKGYDIENALYVFDTEKHGKIYVWNSVESSHDILEGRESYPEFYDVLNSEEYYLSVYYVGESILFGDSKMAQNRIYMEDIRK